MNSFEWAGDLLAHIQDSLRAGEFMTNEERFAQCKLSIIYEWKDNYSLYALGLLHHGYLLECGKRGGLRKRWIGHASDETVHYAHLRDVYERAVAARHPKKDEEWSDTDDKFVEF